MRLTWKDAAATMVTAVVLALYGAYLAGVALPLVSGPRALAGTVLVLGFVGCALGNGAMTGERYRVPRYTTATALGVTSLVAGLWALLTGNGVALAVLVAATVTLWAMATAFHLCLPATASRAPANRELVGQGRGGRR
jgi:hypothetical protein